MRQGAWLNGLLFGPSPSCGARRTVRLAVSSMEAVVVAKQVLGHLVQGHMPPREVTSLFISKVRKTPLLGVDFTHYHQR